MESGPFVEPAKGQLHGLIELRPGWIAIGHQSVKTRAFIELGYGLHHDWIVAASGDVVARKGEYFSLLIGQPHVFEIVFGFTLVADTLDRKTHAPAIEAFAGVTAQQ
jgi:hypothetical protein